MLRPVGTEFDQDFPLVLGDSVCSNDPKRTVICYRVVGRLRVADYPGGPGREVEQIRPVAIREFRPIGWRPCRLCGTVMPYFEQAADC